MSYKLFKPNDIICVNSTVEEKICLDRTFFSGTDSLQSNVRNPVSWHSASLSGGVFSVIYDMKPTDPSANKLCTVAYGIGSGSSFYKKGSSYEKEKVKIYQLFARHLLGNKDSIFNIGSSGPCPELAFLSINRNLFKDEIVQRADHPFYLKLIRSGSFKSNPDDSITLTMSTAAPMQFPGGRAYYLTYNQKEYGLVFSQHGTIAFVPNYISGTGNFWSGSLTYEQVVTGASGATPDNLLFGLRHRIMELSMSNVSRVKTTFYRCEAEKHEFNYSSNPSFVDEHGRIRTNSGSLLQNESPQTYITTVALVGKNGEILAVGKASKPIKKNDQTRIVVNVRLDY